MCCPIRKAVGYKRKNGSTSLNFLVDRWKILSLAVKKLEKGKLIEKQWGAEEVSFDVKI